MGTVGVAAACRARVLDVAAPPPPILEGSSLRPTKPKSCYRIKRIEHVFGGGTFWVNNRYGCVGLSVLQRGNAALHS